VEFETVLYYVLAICTQAFIDQDVTLAEGLIYV